MSNRLAVTPQYLLPKRVLTVLAGKFANLRGGALTHAVIRKFVAHYGVDMAEAADPRIESYATFNDFFTRPLREGARPIADAPFVCPVDAAISQFGPIEHDQIFQAKGHSYSTRALVGGDQELAHRFDHGHFATLYLAPKDYHRIHMPCEGRLHAHDLRAGRPVLGQPAHGAPRAQPVRPQRARGLRVRYGVRAVHQCAGGRDHRRQRGHGVAWRGQSAAHPRHPRVALRRTRTSCCAKGAEMGRFLLGSTVVMLFPRNVADLRSRLGADAGRCGWARRWPRAYWNATSSKLRSLRLCSRWLPSARRISMARMPMRRCWSTRSR